MRGSFHQSHRFSDQKLRLFHVVLKNVIHIFCGQGIDIICRRVMGHRVLNKSTQRTLRIQEIRDVQIHTDRANDLSVFVRDQCGERFIETVFRSIGEGLDAVFHRLDIFSALRDHSALR